MGQAERPELDLKITQVITNATGTVSFHDPTPYPAGPPADANPANDKALVVINSSTGGTVGALPITGTRAGLVALGDAVLLLAGAGLYLIARRRRIVTTAGADE